MPLYLITMHSPLPPAEAAEAMAAITQAPRRRGWFEGPATPMTANQFTGTVNADGFRIMRTISYRNSFLPLIEGRLRATPHGSEVRLRMRLIYPVLVFIAVFAFTFVRMLENVGHDLEGYALIAPLFAMALTLAGFIPEALIAKRKIARALQADD